MNRKIKILLAIFIALILSAIVYLFTQNSSMWGQTSLFKIGGENSIITTTPINPKQAEAIVTTTPVKQFEKTQSY